MWGGGGGVRVDVNAENKLLINAKKSWGEGVRSGREGRLVRVMVIMKN